MLKKFLLSIGILFLISIGTEAQSTCSCSVPYGCSANQTCPAKYLAVCTCSPSGCSSECVKEGEGELDLVDANSLVKLLSQTQNDKIGPALSTAFGKHIVFVPADPGFVPNYRDLSLTSHWDVLEYLAKNGTLTINRRELDFWNGLREGLSSGTEFQICSGNASTRQILNQLSFLSGKRFQLTSADKELRSNDPVTGNGLSGLLENLSRTRNVSIKTLM